MRLFFHKISLIVSSILSVLLFSYSTTPVVDNISNDTIKDNNIVEEKSIIETNKEESDQKELQTEEKQTTEILEDKKTNSDSSTSTTSISSNNNNEQKNNSYNISKEQVTNSTTSIPNEVKEEVQVQENKVVNQYIGVPSPNDFYYSFHHGHIDRNYGDLYSCYNKATEVALQDTIDIINTTCYEVLDGQGTILGIYMDVNCNSGNCSRYKEMVGIITD